MKKLFWMMLLLGPGLMSFAQQQGMQKKMMHDKDSMQHKMGGMMKMHQPNFDKLKADLGLTDKQVSDWKKLEESSKPSMDKMHEQHMGEMKEMQQKHKAEMDKMMKEKDEKLKTILTKEQYEKFIKNRPKPGQMRPDHDKHDGHDGPPPAPEN
ncbi:Spy/CpxP family protein refolding chaperone [Pelobium sp.]|nr:Spy/CpxP family protein refolding chaperone [Pelobium sp.]MDA9555616.1 Spy/CpxP family protein refolding chaperone [Pelobium sp.]